MHQARKVVLLLTLLIAGLGFAGCELSPSGNEFAEITFRHIPQIRLDVREIEVEFRYLPPNQDPNVDHRFPDRPMDATARWARDRLVAAGPARRARFIIGNAAVTETRLETKGGVAGALTIEQTERYEGRIEVELQIIADNGAVEGTVTAQITRSSTAAEDLTLNEREQMWYRMTESMMKDLDAQLDSTIKQHLYRFILL